MDETSVIVIGGLNTDIIALGASNFPRPNELARARKMKIGPGGKSRNIADMAAHLLPPGKVAMIGRTAHDSFGLWKVPVDALKAAGVNTDYVKILSADETEHFPSMALLGVDDAGNNQCFLIPGVSDEFSQADLDEAEQLFAAASQNKGIFALSLECPLETAKYGIQKANEFGLKVLLDPGGIITDMDISDLLQTGVYLIKPNEHEAELITGVPVTDFESARQAADILKQKGAQNVLITHGNNGAYLFGDSGPMHISVPVVEDSADKDATGCGDQTMAALCALLQESNTLEEASKAAVAAGTHQFHRAGIQPITKEELNNLLS